MERSVLCFSHCDSNIFCFQLPAECPSCGEEVGGHHLQEAPVSLPPPFTDGHKSSCCLLITAVDRDFSDSSELHTGISDTSGVVYNYTCAGVLRDTSGWQHCVSIPLVRPDRFSLLAQWDQYLQTFSSKPMWDPTWHSFHADNHNCFSFCLQFINSVMQAEGRQPLTQEVFIQTFILPRMTRVSKFLRLYAHLHAHQYYLEDRR
ncbi:MKRN2 opposite strand protein [Synchiropus picturatus]